ncbi:hypothetical protein COBT_001491 [Conglomerata obtusa]
MMHEEYNIFTVQDINYSSDLQKAFSDFNIKWRGGTFKNYKKPGKFSSFFTERVLQNQCLEPGEKIIADKYFNIVMIDNCLYQLEDYKLFYNEFMKTSKTLINIYNLIFLALKLDSEQQTTFETYRPWQRREDISVNNFLNLEYTAHCLEKEHHLVIIH